MTNTLYFHNIVRGDSSSVEENMEKSEPIVIESNLDGFEATPIQRNEQKPDAKGPVSTVIGKAVCFCMARTNSFVNPATGLEIEGNGGGGGGGEVEKKVKKQGKSLSERKLGTKLSNRLYEEFVYGRWPSWLILYAGEALKGWTPRREDSFEKLVKIGKGRHGYVYKARDSLTGKIVALEEVQLDIKHEDMKYIAREILILRQLDHPNVIKLEGLVTSRMSPSLYLLFEYMEHSLSGLAASREIKFTVPQVKCYMHQLLSGLEHCHNHGVLHRDIKGSNLLLDNQGTLKITNFECATFFDPNQENPMTSHMVTLRYRAPEILLGAINYGIGIDLWSAGCILAELLAGKPIMPGRTEVEQVHKIFKLCGSPSKEYWKKLKLSGTPIFKPHHPYRRCLVETFKNFPPSSLPLIETLLAYDPAERRTATAALQSDFFTTEPYACERSSLQQYPPSNDIGAKLPDEGPKRQTAPSGKDNGKGTRSTSTYTKRTSKFLEPVCSARDSTNLDVCQFPIGHANVAMSRDKFPLRNKDKAAASTSTSSCPCSPSLSPVSRPPDVFYSPPGLTSGKISPVWYGYDTPVLSAKPPPFGKLPEFSKKSPSLHKNRAVGLPLPLGSSARYNPSFGPDASHRSMARPSPRGPLQSATVLETAEDRERLRHRHKDEPVNLALDPPCHCSSSSGSDFSFSRPTLTPRGWSWSTLQLDTVAIDSHRPKKNEPRERDHKR